MSSSFQRKEQHPPDPAGKPRARDASSAAVGERWTLLLLFAAALGLAATLTHDRVFLAGNDASRFAHIQALAEHGHSHIDGSRYAWTPDRVILEGRSFSNKPPLMGMLGAGLYAGLHHGFGLDFHEHEARTVYLLTLVLVGGSLALLVPLFHRALGLHPGLSSSARLATTAALGAGTILTSFSGTLNSHPVAALLLFAAFVSALAGRGLAAGGCVALATCLDVVPGVLFIPALASITFDSSGRAGLRRYLLAGAAGALLFFAANWLTVGHPMPPKLVPGGIDVASRVAPSVAGVVLPTRWTYPIESLFGWHGFFSVSPVLLFGAAGLIAALRGNAIVGRRSTLLLAGSTAATILFHALVAGSFGGWSYGFRYLIPIVPILLFFAPLLWRGLLPRIFAPVLALSVLLALIGAYNPWPPVDEQLPDGQGGLASLVTSPVGANLAAWAEEHVPDAAVTRALGARFISPDPVERRRYLSLFFRSKGDTRMLAELQRRSLRE
jgi:hypothetical protein